MRRAMHFSLNIVNLPAIECRRRTVVCPLLSENDCTWSFIIYNLCIYKRKKWASSYSTPPSSPTIYFSFRSRWLASEALKFLSEIALGGAHTRHDLIAAIDLPWILWKKIARRLRLWDFATHWEFNLSWSGTGPHHCWRPEYFSNDEPSNLDLNASFIRMRIIDHAHERQRSAIWTTIDTVRAPSTYSATGSQFIPRPFASWGRLPPENLSLESVASQLFDQRVRNVDEWEKDRVGQTLGFFRHENQIEDRDLLNGRWNSNDFERWHLETSTSDKVERRDEPTSRRSCRR